MHAAIVCPGCQRSYAATERVRGKTVRCPSCGTKFTVPAEEAPPPPEEVAIPQAVALPDEPSSEEIIYMAEEVPSASERPAAAPTATADDSASQVPAGTRPTPDATEDDGAAWVLPADLKDHAAMSAAAPGRGHKKRRRKQPARAGAAGSRMWAAAAAAVLGVGLLGGLGYVAVTRLLPAFRQKIDASAWRDFSPPGGNFKIEMPGTPKYTRQVQPFESDQLQVHTHEVVLKSPERSFGVSYSDYPDWVIRQQTVELRLDGSRDGMIQALAGKLRSEKRLTLNGFPGRELDIEIPHKGTGIVRLYAVNQRIFILTVGGADLKPDSSEVRRFFNSFQLQGVSTPPVPANRFNQPRPQVPQPPPEPPPLPYVPTPVQPVVIKPPSLNADKVVVSLPAPVGDVAVGGGGRFLILHLPSLRELAIFDANEAKVVRELPLTENPVFIAAGMDKLIVVLPQSRQVLRYSLLTFQQEAKASLPIKYNLTAVAMGSASNGPLLVESARNFQMGEMFFFDIISMKKVGIRVNPGMQLPLGPNAAMRASADGQVFCSFANLITQSYVLHGQAIYPYHVQGGGGLGVPGPNGRVIFTPQGLLTRELQPITRAVRTCIPAHQRPYFLSLLPAASGTTMRTVGVHLGQDPRLLIKLADIDLGVFQPWDKHFSLDKRLHLIPDAKLLVVLPGPANRLVLHRVDLDSALEKSGIDYLVVTSQPPTAASKGSRFTYSMQVRSKRGGLKYHLEAGPKGMEVAPDGVVHWSVPGAFAEADCPVVIRVSDLGGQEVFQSFPIKMGTKTEFVAVRPKPPAIVTPDKVPDFAPPPPVSIRAAVLNQDQVTHDLPGTIQDVVVGGGGRFLILSLPKVRKLAIFDVSEAKVVKYLPMGEEEVHIAAGMNKLFVALPQNRILQRWSLETFEREATIPAPWTGTMIGLCMGSASRGPLLLSLQTNPPYPAGQRLFLDPITFQILDFQRVSGTLPSDGLFIRAAPNGKVFTMREAQTREPHLVFAACLQARKIHVHSRWELPCSILVPGPDGQTLYSAAGTFNQQLQGAVHQQVSLLPTQRSPVFVRLDPSGRPGEGQLFFYVPGNPQPFGKLGPVQGIYPEAINFAKPRDPLTYDKRVHVIPAAKLVITIPSTNDRLLLHRFDVEAALAKSDVNYLVATSEPPAAAGRGATYTYPIQVRSRKGGLKYRLEFGPKDMQVSPDGQVTWPVPLALPEAECAVIISITDAGGQELFQSFKIHVDFIPGAPPNRGGPGGPPRGTVSSIRGHPTAGPPQVAVIQAPVLEADKVTRPLPADIGSVALGGGGRFLILHLPQADQLAIFDVNEAKVVKSIALNEENVKFAADMDRLLVAFPRSGILQRWNLLTLEREAVVPVPVKGSINGLLMGSASDGPLFLSYEEEGRIGQGGVGILLDSHTLQMMDRRASQPRLPGLSPRQPMRISADGRVLGLWHVSAPGIQTFVHVGKEWKQFYSRDQAGHVLLGPDGRILFTDTKGLLSNETKPWPGSAIGPRCLIPAPQGSWYGALAPESASDLRPRSFHQDAQSLTVGLLDESRPITTLRDIDLGKYPLLDTTLSIDQRIILLPFAQVLITIPTSNDRLVLYRFDTDQILQKSGVDYLLGASHPLPAVRKGSVYHYHVKAKSNHGGLKYRLDSGPRGLTISDKGEVSWAVPADWSEAESNVIITLSDTSGREVLHTFTVRVID